MSDVVRCPIGAMGFAPPSTSGCRLARQPRTDPRIQHRIVSGFQRGPLPTRKSALGSWPDDRMRSTVRRLIRSTAETSARDIIGSMAIGNGGCGVVLMIGLLVSGYECRTTGPDCIRNSIGLVCRWSDIRHATTCHVFQDVPNLPGCPTNERTRNPGPKPRPRVRVPRRPASRAQLAESTATPPGGHDAHDRFPISAGSLSSNVETMNIRPSTMTAADEPSYPLSASARIRAAKSLSASSASSTHESARDWAAFSILPPGVPGCMARPAASIADKTASCSTHALFSAARASSRGDWQPL